MTLEERCLNDYFNVASPKTMLTEQQDKSVIEIREDKLHKLITEAILNNDLRDYRRSAIVYNKPY